MKKIFVILLILLIQPALADFENMCGVNGYSVFNAVYTPYLPAEYDNGPFDADDTFTCAANTPRVLNAVFELGTYTCAAGYYLPANSETCTACPAGFYCSGGTYTFNETITQGITGACPVGTYLDTTGGAGVNDCLPCAGATYNDETGMASCKTCPVGYDYNTAPGKTDITRCQIHCDVGMWNGEYTQLEYIESTGTQYIDTGYKPNNRTVLKGKGYWKAMNGALIVVRWSGSPTYDTFGVYMGSESLVFYNGRYSDDKIIRVENIPPLYTVYDYEMLLDRVVYNNTTVNMTRDTFQSLYSLFIGAFNDNGAARKFYNGRIYQQTIIENGTVIHDFIPVRRNSDGAVGMYDLVSGAFFGNAGTGTFVAGPDVGPFDGKCVDVGAGYYAAESVVNYGSVGTRTACPAGLSTVGYGHGADNANDCARVLHIDDKVLYARRDKITTPSLNIAVPNEGTYYISLSPTDHTLSRLHFSYGGNKYTAYDDSLFYGERDFDTGQPITQ